MARQRAVAVSPVPAAFPRCRSRLSIGYRTTADRLQGQVEFAYRTDWTQVTATILWGGRIDDVSRRMLTDALLLAAHGGCPVRIPAFAVAARDLFRRTAHTLAARHGARARRGCFGRPARHGLSQEFIPEAGPLHDDLLAATRDLRNHARLRPHVAIVQGAQVDRPLQGALLALRELSDSIADYLEQVLWPFPPYIGRRAVHAFILETRREARQLAACHTPGDVYVEALTVTDPDDKAVNLEVEGRFGAAVE